MYLISVFKRRAEGDVVRGGWYGFYSDVFHNDSGTVGPYDLPEEAFAAAGGEVGRIRVQMSVFSHE
jgi:hypothetical protein